MAPFHWEIEFPEVFERALPAPGERGSASLSESAGFDAIVGNPPFLGGKRISTNLGDGYRDWLADMHAGSNSNADLVAHFFRRAFDLVRQRGAFGLIATNTIAQGDTRASGLCWICQHGGEIYAARRRVPWPGQAAVIVSVVHVGRAAPGAPWRGPRALDGSQVERITAFLFHRGGHDDPVRLAAQAGKSFVGMFLRGMGFTFDDTDTRGAASPLTEMRRLIQRDPRNQEAIFPYIGGKEVNTSPTHAHHRYVINFRDWPLQRESVGARDATGGSSATDGASMLGESPGGGYPPWTGDPGHLRRRVRGWPHCGFKRYCRTTRTVLGGSHGRATPRVAPARPRAAGLSGTGGGRLPRPAADRRGTREASSGTTGQLGNRPYP